MKHLIILILSFVILLKSNVQAQFVKAELQVSGLTCSMCSKSVDKALHTMSFIDKIDVDLEHATYLITFKNNADVNPDLIAQKVTGAGFTVSKLVMWYNFNNVDIPENGHWKLGTSSFMSMSPGKKHVNGLQALTFVDYAFIPKKDFRKNLATTHYNCYQTGYTQSCCPSEMSVKTRIYHVLL